MGLTKINGRSSPPIANPLKSGKPMLHGRRDIPFALSNESKLDERVTDILHQEWRTMSSAPKNQGRIEILVSEKLMPKHVFEIKTHRGDLQACRPWRVASHVVSQVAQLKGKYLKMWTELIELGTAGEVGCSPKLAEECGQKAPETPRRGNKSSQVRWTFSGTGYMAGSLDADPARLCHAGLPLGGLGIFEIINSPYKRQREFPIQARQANA